MEYVEIILLVAGVIALIAGYRLNQRNLLLSAAISLFLAGSIGDMARGFSDGFKTGSSSAAVVK